MVQQAFVQELTSILDPQMSESSYGFRRNRSANQALKAGSAHVEQGYKVAVDLDLEKFFDKRLARRIKDKRVLYYIRQMLKAGMMNNEGIKQKREQGTPQGGPLSPLLANVLSDDLDKELESRGLLFCRYADDGIIFVRTTEAGERELRSISQYIEEELKVNQQNKLFQNKFSQRETHTTLAQGVRVWESGEVAMHFPLSQVLLPHCPILGNAELQNCFLPKIRFCSNYN